MFKNLIIMKNLVFAVLAMFVLLSCDPTSNTPGKCNDLNELQEAIIKGSNDTARYDLNGDGEITIADINFLIEQMRTDTTKVDTV